MKNIKWTNEKRSVEDGPFCWTNKMALRIIRKELRRMGIKTHCTILCIYHALAEISSNKERQKFSCYQYEIAALAGCSTSTVNRGLKVLETIGAIESIPAMFDVKDYGLPIQMTPPKTYVLLKVERTYSIAGRTDGYANYAYYNKGRIKGDR